MAQFPHSGSHIAPMLSQITLTCPEVPEFRGKNTSLISIPEDGAVQRANEKIPGPYFN